MDISQYIPFGRENAKTREHLSKETGLSDRNVREAIEQARAQGHIIINNQDGKGYYQSNNIEEINQQYWQIRHRALSILRQQKHLRKILKAAGREV